MSTALSPQQNTNRKVQSLKKMLEAGKDQLENALQKHLDPDRMIRCVINAAVSNQKIFDCSLMSMAQALMKAGQFGIEPDGIHGHIVPYKDVATFIPDYKGFIQLAYQNPRVKKMFAAVVHEGDFFEFEYGLQEKLRHRPTPGERGKLIYAYAIAQLDGCDPQFVVMNDEEVEKRKQSSQTGRRNSGPWVDWTEEMWKKTAIKSIVKLLPLGPQMPALAESDSKQDAGVIEADYQVVDTPGQRNQSTTEALSNALESKFGGEPAQSKPKSSYDIYSAEVSQLIDADDQDHFYEMIESIRATAASGDITADQEIELLGRLNGAMKE